MAEFPGRIQQLSGHSPDLESLAVNLIKSIQSQDMEPSLRANTYQTRLQARFVSKRFDPSLIPSIMSLAHDLKLFDNREPYHN